MHTNANVQRAHANTTTNHRRDVRPVSVVRRIVQLMSIAGSFFSGGWCVIVAPGWRDGCGPCMLSCRWCLGPWPQCEPLM